MPGAVHTREVLAERFAQLLKALELDAEVVEWVASAPRESHADEKHEREELIVVPAHLPDGGIDDARLLERLSQWADEGSDLSQSTGVYVRTV